MTQITYYSARSAYAYLGSTALMDLCARHRLTRARRPIPMSPVVGAQSNLPCAQRTQAHIDYLFGREIEWWAELRGFLMLPMRPLAMTRFPVRLAV